MQEDKRRAPKSKTFSTLSFLALLGPAIVFPLQEAGAETSYELYMQDCEKKIAEHWFKHSLPKYLIPFHFRVFAKGVVSFELDCHGYPRKCKIKHTSKESLVVAARLRYGLRGDAMLKALDKSMIESVQESAPFASPPEALQAHRHFAVIFDTQRYQPLRMFMDDNIPVAGGISTLRF